MGDFFENKKHGVGTFVWKDGRKYIGEWKNGVKDGIGMIEHTNGDVIKGEWLKG